MGYHRPPRGDLFGDILGGISDFMDNVPIVGTMVSKLVDMGTNFITTGIGGQRSSMGGMYTSAGPPQGAYYRSAPQPPPEPVYYQPPARIARRQARVTLPRQGRARRGRAVGRYAVPGLEMAPSQATQSALLPPIGISPRGQLFSGQPDYASTGAASRAAPSSVSFELGGSSLIGTSVDYDPGQGVVEFPMLASTF